MKQLQTSSKEAARRRRRRIVTDAMADSRLCVSTAAYGWRALSAPQKAAWNSLCVRMQAAKLLPPGPHQTGYTLLTALTRARLGVYGGGSPGAAPPTFVLPPSLPDITVQASEAVLHLGGDPYACGVQIAASAPFVPGCRDPYSQRCGTIMTLPGGWGADGVDLRAAYTAKRHRLETGMALLLKVVPVSADGFVGPAWCGVIILE